MTFDNDEYTLHRSTQAPFHERGTAVVRGGETNKDVVYNPNVVYTTRPVFKYTWYVVYNPNVVYTTRPVFKYTWYVV